MLIRTCTFLLFFSFILDVRASHIVGGEFNLAWKGRGPNYLLTLNMYYDEINADKTVNLIGQAITAVIYEKGTNAFVREVYMTLDSKDNFIDYSNRYCARGDLVTRILHYKADVSLPGGEYSNPQGYYVVYDLCCRNKIISNIKDPDNTGMIFYMEFSSKERVPRNSAPKFRQIEGEYFCADIEHAYDFSAVDPDGDSLVYSLTFPIKGNTSGTNPTPRPGPYSSVVWAPGYSEANMLPGNPGLSIGRSTGILQVKPLPSTINNVYVIGVKVDEYRDGVKIGTVHREFQFKVVRCDINYEPLVRFREPEGPYYAPDDTIVVEFAETRCVQLEVSDPSSNEEMETIRLSTLGSLPSNVFTVSPRTVTLSSGAPLVAGEVCLINCQTIPLERDSVFDLKVVASDDGCPVPLRDTATIKVLLKGRFNNPPVVDLADRRSYQMIVGDTIDLMVYGRDKDADDMLTLTMESNNDALLNGFSFETVVGRDSVVGIASGVARCEHLNEPHTLLFKITDESCSPSKWDTVTVEITVRDKPTEITGFTPVNLITPNGDGKNDYFYLKDLPEGNCSYFFTKIEIFNRWGGKVFVSDDPAFQWDAKNNPSGMYYYRVNLNKDDIYGWINVVKDRASKLEKEF